MESVKQAGLLLLFFCAGGMLSNLPMMLPGIAGVAISRNNTGDRMTAYIQWGVMAVIGLITCAIFAYALAKSCGNNSALFVINHKLERKLDMRWMMITVGGGLLAYLVLSLVLMIMNIQPLDGPVQYIMRIIGQVERRINESEIANVPYLIRAVSVLIYMVILAPFPFLGYRKGYEERLSFQEEEEKEKGSNENTPRD